MKGIAVFGASSNTLDEIYYEASSKMGELIAKNGCFVELVSRQQVERKMERCYENQHI